MFKKLMRHKPMRLMIIGLTIVFGGLIVFNIGKKALMQYIFTHFEPPAVTVSSVSVQQVNWHPNLHAVGEFSAVNGVDINSEAAGNVVAIYFESGQIVKKNQLLIQIDDSTDQATLKSNEANLAFQKINFSRQEVLVKRNASSQSEADAAKAEMLKAEANVEYTKAIIAQKQIKAPFTGRIGIRMINLGQYIMPGQTDIVTLQSLDPLFLEFYIPEQYLSQVHVGQNIFFSTEPDTHKKFTGKITAINAKVDSQTHNVKIQATVPNCPPEVFNEQNRSGLFSVKTTPDTNQKLFICNTEKNTQANLMRFAFIPGMFASIEVEQPAIENALILPSTAISYSLYGDSVFVITPKMIGDTVQKDKDGHDILTVERVYVTTGGEQGNQVLMTKGLKAGQTVVSAGEIKLENGTRVIINNDVPLNASAHPKLVGE